MAELSEAGGTGELSEDTPTGGSAGDAATIRELRARVAELERLLEARTQAIVGMGARLAELEGSAPASASERVRELEHELSQLRATKVIRYSEVPRRLYGRLRRGAGG